MDLPRDELVARAEEVLRAYEGAGAVQPIERGGFMLKLILEPSQP